MCFRKPGPIEIRVQLGVTRQPDLGTLQKSFSQIQAEDDYLLITYDKYNGDVLDEPEIASFKNDTPPPVTHSFDGSIPTFQQPSNPGNIMVKYKDIQVIRNQQQLTLDTYHREAEKQIYEEYTYSNQTVKGMNMNSIYEAQFMIWLVIFMQSFAVSYIIVTVFDLNVK